MVARTLNDLDFVDDVEQAIRKLDPWVSRHVSDEHLNSNFLKNTGLDRRYGLRAQISITILLSVAAAWFVFGDKIIPVATNVSAVNVNCQSVPSGSSVAPTSEALSYSEKPPSNKPKKFTLHQR
jgi:hypothetical protein